MAEHCLVIPGMNLHCLVNRGFVSLLPRFLPFSLCSFPVSLPCPIPTSLSQFGPKLVWLQLQPEFVQGDPHLALKVQGKALGF